MDSFQRKKKQKKTFNARKLLKLNFTSRGWRITFCLHLNSQEHNKTSKNAKKKFVNHIKNQQLKNPTSLQNLRCVGAKNRNDAIQLAFT